MINEDTKNFIYTNLNNYKQQNDDTEFEIRIGKLTQRDDKNTFDPNLSSEYFHQKKKLFLSNKTYLNKEDSIFYELKKGSVRVRYDNNRIQIESVKKRRKKDNQLLIKDSSFDIRLSFSKEAEVDKNVDFNKKKAVRKKRTTFTFPYTVVDMTITNRGRYNIYQIELELVTCPNTGDESNYALKEIEYILNLLLY